MEPYQCIKTNKIICSEMRSKIDVDKKKFEIEGSTEKGGSSKFRNFGKLKKKTV